MPSPLGPFVGLKRTTVATGLLGVTAPALPQARAATPRPSPAGRRRPILDVARDASGYDLPLVVRAP
ncbi:hypothetical protein [Streptomyces mesophilus]|uniref:hypothetical protein n=1 Tax=Streptomyces mesophilus TaxID=1775132 RepID=UPI0033286497